MKIAPLPLAILVLVVTAIMTVAAVPSLRGTLFYPRLTALVAQDLQIDFRGHGVTDRLTCTSSLDSQAAVLRQTCPACKIINRLCVTSPEPSFFIPYSDEPLTVPSGRHAGGVVLYSSASPDLALAVCRETERHTAQAEPHRRLRCYPPATPRPRGNPR